ncbi:alpha/beta hydrolase [Rhodococcus rhodnii]|nr:alpha/beta hydrolase [Rhodococcus rhodnii]
MAHNAWRLSLGGGMGEPARTPSTLVRPGEHRDLYRFGDGESGRTILLVPPFAVPATCYDLRPGQSLAEHLVAAGHRVHALDFGEITSRDRDLGFEHWVNDIVPDAIETVSALSGDAEVDVLGWSLGGTLSLLTAAAHPDLPISSIAALGTPIDYREIPTIAPLRLVGRVTTERPLTTATNAVGRFPAPLVQASYRFTALRRELTRPWFVLRNLHDEHSLSHMETIDRFMAAMPGYPARVFEQMCRQLILENRLARGEFELGSGTVSLADVTTRVLVVGSETDVIAPAASARRACDVLTGADVRYVDVPGSHLGIVAGGTSAATTYAEIDAFLAEIDSESALLA